jgi:hypothetical protein
MSWFYQHKGQTHGPVSSAEIKELASKGLLDPDDSIWGEGTDQTQAIPASAAVDFSKSAQPSSVPDWLGDIASQESKGPAVELAASAEAPEWLDDMRLWIGLELYPAVEDQETGPAGTGAIPDWLEGWLTPPPPTTKPETPPAKPDRKAPAKPAIPIAKIVEAAPAPKHAIPIAKIVEPPVAPKHAIPVAKIVETPPPAPKTPIPIGKPVPPPPRAKPAIPIAQPAFAPAQALAEKTLAETGFDVLTGRILDQEKFDQWKKQKAPAGEPSQQYLTNASQFEVFRKARTAIETWVDDEKNKLRILHADIKEILQSAGIQAIFRDYAGFGFRQKLEKHLAFLVENRRKYESALKKKV